MKSFFNINKNIKQYKNKRINYYIELALRHKDLKSMVNIQV